MSGCTVSRPIATSKSHFNSIAKTQQTLSRLAPDGFPRSGARIRSLAPQLPHDPQPESPADQKSSRCYTASATAPQEAAIEQNRSAQESRRSEPRSVNVLRHRSHITQRHGHSRLVKKIVATGTISPVADNLIFHEKRVWLERIQRFAPPAPLQNPLVAFQLARGIRRETPAANAHWIQRQEIVSGIPALVAASARRIASSVSAPC